MGFPDRDTGRRYVDYLAEYAIRYCTVVFFGEQLANGRLCSKPQAATATLLDLDGTRLIVTNDHVLAEFEKLSDSSSLNIHFQVGRLPFDPHSHLISRDSGLDICTFRADELDIDELTDRLKIDPIPPLEFYRTSRWPPIMPKDGDKLVWAGFPSSLRHLEDDTRFTVPLTFTGPKVPRVEEAFIISNEDPDRKDWAVHYGEGLTPDSDPLKNLGGMSGGPAFLIDRADLVRPELVGIISSYQAMVNQMRLSRLDMVRSDGTISAVNR